MSETENERIEDPCIRICVLSDDLTWCKGCGRTTEQIRLWWMMTDEEKLDVLAQAREKKED